MTEENKAKMQDGWFSKKWLLCLASLIAGIAIELATDRGISPEMVALLLGLPGLYGYVNVSNKKALIGGDK